MKPCMVPGCQRAATETPGGLPLPCHTHTDRLLTAAFGVPQRERVYVQRLSEQDEFCVSVAETSRERVAA